MIRDSLRTLRWCATLGAKFIRVVPYATLTVIALTMVSQLAIMVAMLLPLKIILLLGAEGMPRYFPDSFNAIDRQTLIVVLTGSTIASFFLHTVLEKLIARISEFGARKLLAKSEKVTIFDKQNELASKSYQQYANALAGGLFAIVVVLVLLLVYPLVGLTLVVCLATMLATVRLTWSRSPDFRELLSTKPARITKVANKLGFFAIFLALVVDFLLLTPPSLLLAIIAVILSRQAFGRLAATVNFVFALAKQRDKLDALYFHGKVWLPDSGKERDSLWSLVSPNQSTEWLSPLLRDLNLGHDGKLFVEFFETGISGVPAIKVSDDGDLRLLVKLFSHKRAAWAQRESELLTSIATRIPAPTWVGSSLIRGHHCHVLQPDFLDRPEIGTELKNATRQLEFRTAGVDADARMQRQFLRSRASLPDRLNVRMFERLIALANPTRARQLQWLKQRLGLLQSCLRTVPLGIYNPDIKPGAIISDPASDAVGCIHWGRWSLEPVGFMWPLTDKGFDAGCEAMQSLGSHRPVLRETTANQFRIVALASALERCSLGELYDQAIRHGCELAAALENESDSASESLELK